MSQLNLSAPPGHRVPKTFPRRPGRRSVMADLSSSAIGLKWLMAISGLAMMGFVLAHMIGNLHLYEGPEEVNSYAEALRNLGGDLAPEGFVLWLMRAGLLVAVLVHAGAAYRLTVVNHRARPVRYQSKRDYIAADYASRAMRLTGIWVAAFIVYHLADLTGGRSPSADNFIHGDVYNNVVESLSNPVVAAFYILSVAALSLHLYHGAWSLFQTMGASSPSTDHLRRGVASGFALVLLVGNLSFPVMVQLGVIDQDERCWPTPEQLDFADEVLGLSHDDIARDQEAGACPARDLADTARLTLEPAGSDDPLGGDPLGGDPPGGNPVSGDPAGTEPTDDAEVTE